MDYRQQLNTLLADRFGLQRSLARERAVQSDICKRLQAAEAARGVVLAVSEQVQQQAHHRIATVVTRCLQAVFGNIYEFRVMFTQKRGRTEASLQFLRGDLVLDDPLSQVGGGVVDVAAFALRVSALLLRRPPLRRVLVLDEPFRNIRGKHYRQRIRGMVQALAEDLGIQFIINIDHDQFPEFLDGAGAVVDFRGIE